MLKLRKSILAYTLCLALVLSSMAFFTVPSFADTSMQPYLCGVTTNSIWVVVECNSTATATVDYGTTTSYGSTATTANTQTTTNSTYVHNIKLTGLSANTTYHYRVRQGASTSADYTFKTAVNPGTGFRFAFFADTRTGTSIHDSIASRIKAANPAFVLFGGDLANDGSYNVLKNEFFRTNELNLLSTTPIFFTPGNHEGWSTNAKAFFQGPASNAANDPDYYSFDYGDMHVVAINSMVSTASGSAQYNFVRDDLAASNMPWKIAFDHYPAYCSGGHGEDGNMKTISANLLEPNGVQMLLSGHSHFYEHNKPSNVHHMVVGSAGAPLYTPSPASYNVLTARKYCYAIVDVTPTTYKYTAYDETGAVIETLNLTAGGGPTPTPKPTPTPTPTSTVTPPPPSGDYLKFTATSSANTAAAKYWFWKISTDAYTFQNGDYIEYDVYNADNIAGLGGIEIYNSGGTWFRDQAGWADQNGIGGHPNKNISSYANGKWYHRKLAVPATMVGKTSSDFDLAIEYNSNSTTYTAYYDNLVVTNGGNVVKSIYQNGNPSANASRGGLEYTCSVSVVQSVGGATPTPTPTPAATPTPTPAPTPTPGGTELFFTGLETGETQATWNNTIETSANVSGYTVGINPECAKRTGEQSHTGTVALMYSGTDDSATSSYCYFKVFDVNIPITASTKMSYWFYPQQENGRRVSIDYICTDGTTLRDSGATDYNGASMHPGTARGTINTWTQIKCDVGQWLSGKTIDRILVGYDQNANTGQFRGYIDDILITNGTLP